MARVLRGEWMLGIGGSTLAAAVTVSKPDGSAAPAEFLKLREEAWQRLGSDARARYDAFVAAADAGEVQSPRLHVNMIGVRRGAKGSGRARVLLDYVHDMAAADGTVEGVALSTENPANVPLYEHFGYRVTGHTRVSPDLSTWALYRPVAE